MTKNEIELLFNKTFKHDYINGQGHMIAPKHEAFRFIDKIYEVIEDKKCKSCIYYEVSLLRSCKHLDIHVPDDWYCKDWRKV